MKTRTLLLLAVACGLVILVAGSIKVFLISEDEAPAHLRVGETGEAGDMRVTLRSADVEGGVLVATVELVGVDDPDGARSFAYSAGSGRVPPNAPAAEGDCAATSVSAPTTCRLVFPTERVPGLLLYERSGDTVRWDVCRDESCAGA